MPLKPHLSIFMLMIQRWTEPSNLLMKVSKFNIICTLCGPRNATQVQHLYSVIWLHLPHDYDTMITL